MARDPAVPFEPAGGDTGNVQAGDKFRTAPQYYQHGRITTPEVGEENRVEQIVRMFPERLYARNLSATPLTARERKEEEWLRGGCYECGGCGWWGQECPRCKKVHPDSIQGEE